MWGRWGLSGAAVVAMGCIRSGGAFPTLSETVPHVVTRAAAAIADASAAGADSLAEEPIKLARQRLALATTEEQAKHADRAGLFAREAIADATYAKAEAERIVAERARAAAASQLEPVSTGTGGGSATPR